VRFDVWRFAAELQAGSFDDWTRLLRQGMVKVIEEIMSEMMGGLALAPRH
jgi:hypothetical protein